MFNFTPLCENCECTVGFKKSSHLPSVQRDGQYRAIPVPFSFNFRAVAVLVHFQTVPILSQRQLVRSSVRLGQQN